MKINKNREEAIKRAVETLEKRGLVIYPTETCYGIGADATNEKAVEKLLKYKKKRQGKPISIAVKDKEMAKKYVELNEIAENIYDNYLPGPITVVSKSKGKVAKKVEAEDGTLGIRIPNYDLVLDIIKNFGRPITATSANASYKKTPYSLQDVVSNISKRQEELVDLFLDAGKLPKNKPSTVINTILNEAKVLREGDVKLNLPKVVYTNSERETRRLAKEIMKNSVIGKKPLVFALQGELGVGKTQFAKGIAEFLKIKDVLISPTFVLVREYKFTRGKEELTLFHIDAYRLFEQKELESLGFKKMLEKPNIIVIEWAEKVTNLLKENLNNIELIWVKLSYCGAKKRKIEYSRFLIWENQKFKLKGSE